MIGSVAAAAWAASALAIAGFFVLYPLVVWLASCFRAPRLPPPAAACPSVSLVVVARNAEALMEEKIRNALALRYPQGQLQIVACSDGSTDGTERILRSFTDQRLQVICATDHRGKIACLNEAVGACTGEIVVFTDADALLDADVLDALVGHFADAGVGGVCGQRVIADGGSELQEAQQSYIGFDSEIKLRESRLGSITSNDGKLYAIRRELFRPIEPAVPDDLFVALNVVRQGGRFVFEPRARARIRLPARDLAHEAARRRRIVSQSFRAIFLLRDLLNPLRHGWFAIGLAVNKVLRRLLPFFLLLLLAASLVLSFVTPWMIPVVIAQGAFYGLACSHLWLRRSGLPSLLRRAASVACYFVLGQYGTLLGVLDFLRGKQVTKWDPLKTAAQAGSIRPAPRVGILIASLQVGGAERASLNLLEGLVASGVEAFVLTLDGNHDLAPSDVALSSRIFRLSRADIGWSTVAKVAVAPWQWWNLQRAVRRLRLDAVVSIVERANIMNLVRLGRARRVISIRSYPSLLLASKAPLKRRLVLTAYRGLLRRADRIVFVSRETGQDFVRLFPAVADRGSVIPNACDVERLRRLASEPLPSGWAGLLERQVVLSCGRLNPEKGHWSLVRAFAEICRNDPHVQLVLLGDGPLRQPLCGLRDELGLTERVHFPGFQPNPLAWMARARVFVLPSLWEGFPNALLEALAAGAPVVSTDCRSGPRELLAPETDPFQKTSTLERAPVGLLVPPPDGLLRAAGQPLSEPERLMARAIDTALHDETFRREQVEPARRAVAGFSPERILPLWVELIAGLAGPGR